MPLKPAVVIGQRICCKTADSSSSTLLTITCGISTMRVPWLPYTTRFCAIVSFCESHTPHVLFTYQMLSRTWLDLKISMWLMTPSIMLMTALTCDRCMRSHVCQRIVCLTITPSHSSLQQHRWASRQMRHPIKVFYTSSDRDEQVQARGEQAHHCIRYA